MSLLVLTGRNIQVALDEDLRLRVQGRDGRPLWASSRSRPPVAVVRPRGSTPRPVPLGAAQQISLSDSVDGACQGQTARLAHRRRYSPR